MNSEQDRIIPFTWNLLLKFQNPFSACITGIIWHELEKQSNAIPEFHSEVIEMYQIHA